MNHRVLALALVFGIALVSGCQQETPQPTTSKAKQTASAPAKAQKVQKDKTAKTTQRLANLEKRRKQIKKPEAMDKKLVKELDTLIKNVKKELKQPKPNQAKVRKDLTRAEKKLNSLRSFVPKTQRRIVYMEKKLTKAEANIKTLPQADQKAYSDRVSAIRGNLAKLKQDYKAKGVPKKDRSALRKKHVKQRDNLIKQTNQLSKDVAKAAKT